MQITETTYSQKTIVFTPPKGVATVEVYLWIAAGTLFADDLSVRSVVVDAGTPDVAVPINDDSMNILVMGVDAQPGEPIDIGVRPDSLMVVHLNPKTRSCHLLAIPRDTRTELPGFGLTKINHALAVGGIPYEQLVVSQLLGISIDHYVLVDFTGFKQLVDALSGITLTVTEGFTDDNGVTFTPGSQDMNGTRPGLCTLPRWS